MLTATKSALKTALALSTDVVERRNTIPILSNVLFERADPKGLQLRMTDLDVEARIVLEATPETDFSGFTVPAHLLREIVNKLPDGAEVKLVASDANLSAIKLKAGRSSFSLNVLPPQDFPDISQGDMTLRFSISAKALVDAIAAVEFAISQEETRYYLNGIFLHLVEGGIMLVATDGHRLSKRFLPLDDIDGPCNGIIIPKKTIGIVKKLLAGPTAKEPEVKVEASDAKIRFSLQGIELTSKLIDGTFPDYVRVIPTSHTGTAEIEASELKAAVDRVTTVSSERGRAAKFRFEEGQLTLEVSNPDAGWAEETLAFEGEANLQIGFNAKYVTEAIASLPNGTLTFHLTDAGSPTILHADGDHKENLIVLMPMRV